MPHGSPPIGPLQPPWPGSDEALDKGCSCPIFDNHHGQGIGGLGQNWYITPDCPLHDPAHPGSCDCEACNQAYGPRRVSE